MHSRSLVCGADRSVRLEALERRFDLDLGDREAPEREAGEEDVPVLGRDEVGRCSCACEKFSLNSKQKERARTSSSVLEHCQQAE